MMTAQTSDLLQLARRERVETHVAVSQPAACAAPPLAVASTPSQFSKREVKLTVNHTLVPPRPAGGASRRSVPASLLGAGLAAAGSEKRESPSPKEPPLLSAAPAPRLASLETEAATLAPAASLGPSHVVISVNAVSPSPPAASPSGGAVASNAAPLWRQSPPNEHGYLCFTVVDEGVGIDPEQLGFIWQPFRQAEMGRERRVGGTGLGLTVRSMNDTRPAALHLQAAALLLLLRPLQSLSRRPYVLLLAPQFLAPLRCFASAPFPPLLPQICQRLATVMNGGIFALSPGIGQGSRFVFYIPVLLPSASPSGDSTFAAPPPDTERLFKSQTTGRLVDTAAVRFPESAGSSADWGKLAGMVGGDAPWGGGGGGGGVGRGGGEPGRPSPPAVKSLPGSARATGPVPCCAICLRCPRPLGKGACFVRALLLCGSVGYSQHPGCLLVWKGSPLLASARR